MDPSSAGDLPTREERGVKGAERHSCCIRRLSIKAGKKGGRAQGWRSCSQTQPLVPNPAACALQAAAAWQQRQESSSASIKALSTSTRSKQGLPRTSQGLSQVPKWRPCLPGGGGPTLASQPEACLPNKETKAFLGPGLRMVTSLHSLPLPCARHCTKPWTWIDSRTLTATGGNQGTERLSA